MGAESYRWISAASAMIRGFVTNQVVERIILILVTIVLEIEERGVEICKYNVRILSWLAVLGLEVHTIWTYVRLCKAGITKTGFSRIGVIPNQALSE